MDFFFFNPKYFCFDLLNVMPKTIHFYIKLSGGFYTSQLWWIISSCVSISPRTVKKYIPINKLIIGFFVFFGGGILSNG